MKKQITIFGAAFLTAALFSCNKGKIEMPETPTTVNEEISTTSSSSGTRTVADPLTVNLEGRFEFDGNLVDKARKLPDGISTSRGGALYTPDRKGKRNGALLLDGFYGIKLSNVPQQTHTSISVWLKIPDRPQDNYVKPIVLGMGPLFTDNFIDQGFGGIYHDIVGGVITGYDSVQQIPIGTYTWVPFPDPGWHHYVITYDGETFKYYFDGDGNYLIDKMWDATIASGKQDYRLGFWDILEAVSHGFWKGSMDDLRFYSRTLTDTDVQKLYHQ
jgi:hypothetical protein